MIFSRVEKEWKKRYRMVMTKAASKLVAVLSVYLFISVFAASPVLAQATIESDNFKIQMPNFNSGAGIPSSSNYKLNTTIGQTAPGLFTSNGYLVRSGFQYINSIIPFSFSLSNFLINFGTLTPGTPSTLTSTLTISSGGAGGYKVTARESDYLKSTDSSIPDATCDDGFCTQSSATPWTLDTAYGFGYNMEGDDVPADFTDSTYYRHFANQAQSQTDQIVMSSAIVGRGRVSTITYKVNISGVQAAGQYQNNILFTAIPSF